MEPQCSSGGNLSASLKERLKRSGRCYTSPRVSKQPRIHSPQIISPVPQTVKRDDDCIREEPAQCSGYESQTDQQNNSNVENQHSPPAKSPSVCEEVRTPNVSLLNGAEQTPVKRKSWCSDKTPTSDKVARNKEKDTLVQEIKDKEEKLRKLKMVKMYRSKNDLKQLDALTCKWRGVVQEALTELVTLSPEPKPSLTQLIDGFQLDHDFIGFSAEDEIFTENTG